MTARFLALLLGFCLAFTAPALAARKALDVQAIKSPGGIEAWLVEDHSVPVISVSFSFMGGLSYEPAEKAGTARLVSILLDEGAGELKAKEFQARESDNAVNMAFAPGRDAFTGRLKTLTENKDTAFDLLRLALTAPRFDADAIERMKAANTAEIKNSLGDPAWLVARTFNGMVFEGHSYAVPGYGTPDSMGRILRSDLQGFARNQFARDALRVTIAGDISPEAAAKALDTIFGALPAKAEQITQSPATLNYGGKTILLPLEAPQTYVSVGAAMIGNKDKDWPAAVVMNYILGGSNFDARLMREIRKKRGLTYGIYSSLMPMRDAALVQVNMSGSNDKIEEALRILRQEWQSFANEGPSPQEVQNAKSYLTGSLLIDLSSTSDISDTLNGLQRDGFGPDYINQRNDMIHAVTPEDVRRVAQKWLKPDQLTTILVGKPRNINVDILLDGPPGMESGNKP